MLELIIGLVIGSILYFALVKPWLDKKPAVDANGKPLYWYYFGMFGDVHAIRKDSTEDKCISVMNFGFWTYAFIFIIIPVVFCALAFFAVIITVMFPIPIDIVAPIFLVLFVLIIARTIQIVWQMSSNKTY